MVSLREWVAFGMGLTTAGVGAWAFARTYRPGRIIWIGDNVPVEYKEGETAGTGTYLVEASVVEAVAARAARVVRKGEPRTTFDMVVMLLIGIHRRGVLSFTKTFKYGDFYEVKMLDYKDGHPDWGIKAGEPAPPIRDVLVELAAYGLARPGPSYRSMDAFEGGRPSGTVNLQVSHKAPREIEVEVERQRPSGSYFKVGDSYYADGKFLERMEWIPGSEYDKKTFTLAVPLWKRGKLLFQEMGKTQTLPEQQGGLYLLKGQLTGVDLEDVLTELVELGLVGWGGEWATMPKEESNHKPTGTPKWNPAGKVRSYEGQEFVDEATVRQMLTRLESTRSPDGTFQIVWRGRSLQLRPATVAVAPPNLTNISIPGMHGKVYALGPSSDAAVKALVDEIIVRRLAYRVKDAVARDARRSDLPVGHLFVGGVEMFVDEPFVKAMLARAEGWSLDTNSLSIHLRYGPKAEVYLHPWDMRLGVAPILSGQVGGAYVLELKGPYGTKPDDRFLTQLTNDIIKSGEGERVPAAPPYPIDAPSNPLLPPGHSYVGIDPPLIDGRLAGLLSAEAQRVIVVDFGIDLDMGEAGVIGLRLFSRKVALNLLPEQVGAIFEVDLSRVSPQQPLLFLDLVTSLVEKGEARRVELSPSTVNIKNRSSLTPEASQP